MTEMLSHSWTNPSLSDTLPVLFILQKDWSRTLGEKCISKRDKYLQAEVSGSHSGWSQHSVLLEICSRSGFDALFSIYNIGAAYKDELKLQASCFIPRVLFLVLLKACPGSVWSCACTSRLFFAGSHLNSEQDKHSFPTVIFFFFPPQAAVRKNAAVGFALEMLRLPLTRQHISTFLSVNKMAKASDLFSLYSHPFSHIHDFTKIKWSVLMF